MYYVGTARQGTIRNASYSATAGTTTAISAGVNKIRVLTTTDAWIVIGNGVTAVAGSGSYLPAKAAEYFTVTPGEVVSAVQDTASGTLNITECT